MRETLTIRDIRTHLVYAYRTNWLFVSVLTSEDGLYGLGEATLEYKEHAVSEAILHLRSALLGRNPFEAERLWGEIYRDAYWRGGPVLMSALSAIDQALWDIKGKSLDVPVYELLGGRVRERIPVYVNGWFAPAKTAAEFAAKARAAAARGYRALKWDPFGSAWLQLSPRAFREAVECVEAVRDAVGSEVELMIEGHGRFDVPTAIRVGKALEPFAISWFEEPIPPDNLEALADVRRKVEVPIAVGERLYGRRDFMTLLKLGAADVWQPDVSHAGGISEVRRIAALAEGAYLPVSLHNPSGPVANAATLQLAATTPNYHVLEFMSEDVPWRKEVAIETLRVEEGEVLIPTGVGLGVDLLWENLPKFPYRETSLRHYKGTLTDIRPPDAVASAQEGEPS